MNKQSNTQQAPPLVTIGLFRRLFAIFYDGILLLAILFTISAIATALNHGTAVEQGDPIYPIMVLLIFSLSYLYFAWFWIHGGQSLGMKTWHMQLQSTDNHVISWKTVSIRFISALFSWGIFGLGFIWSLFNKKNQCWHDLSSRTVLIDLRPFK